MLCIYVVIVVIDITDFELYHAFCSLIGSAVLMPVGDAVAFTTTRGACQRNENRWHFHDVLLLQEMVLNDPKTKRRKECPNYLGFEKLDRDQFL